MVVAAMSAIDQTAASEGDAAVAGTAIPQVPDNVVKYYKKLMWRRGGKIDDTKRLEFGKFKGRPFHEVLVEEPSYCVWCLSHLDVEKKEHKEFLDFMEKSIKAAMTVSHRDEASSSTSKLEFGKFKGKTFSEVFAGEPAYCKWCLSHLDVNNTQHKKFADFLKKASKDTTEHTDTEIGSGPSDVGGISDGKAIVAMHALLDAFVARVELLEHTTVRRVKVKDMDVVEKLAAKAKK